MIAYEYIRIRFDFGDLDEMNRLSSAGWRVVSVIKQDDKVFSYWGLMERRLPEKD